MGQPADRVPMVETEVRVRDLQHAEREQAWPAERKQLEAEIAKRRNAAARGGSKTAMAAAAAAAAGATLESVR